MRRVMRHEDNSAYWDRRWREAGRDADGFEDLTVYPIAFAERVMTDPSAKALEIGAGLGRVMKHYKSRGFTIAGVERSAVAVAQLREEDPAIDIREADVRQLPWRDGAFDVVLAFGVYHNIEDGFDDALAETARCLKPGGKFCISMRPDNLAMRLNEWYWRRKRGRGGAAANTSPQRFHKWLVTASEFKSILEKHGLHTEEVHDAANMSFFYRVPWLRAAQTSEADRRSQGYRLNALGRALDRLAMAALGRQWANVIVFIGRRSAVAAEARDVGALDGAEDGGRRPPCVSAPAIEGAPRPQRDMAGAAS